MPKGRPKQRLVKQPLSKKRAVELRRAIKRCIMLRRNLTDAEVRVYLALGHEFERDSQRDVARQHKLFKLISDIVEDSAGNSGPGVLSRESEIAFEKLASVRYVPAVSELDRSLSAAFAKQPKRNRTTLFETNKPRTLHAGPMQSFSRQ